MSSFVNHGCGDSIDDFNRIDVKKLLVIFNLEYTGFCALRCFL